MCKTTSHAIIRALVGTGKSDDVIVLNNYFNNGKSGLSYSLSNLCIVALMKDPIEFRRCILLQPIITQEEIETLNSWPLTDEICTMVNNISPRISLWTINRGWFPCEHIRDMAWNVNFRKVTRSKST